MGAGCCFFICFASVFCFCFALVLFLLCFGFVFALLWCLLCFGCCFALVCFAFVFPRSRKADLIFVQTHLKLYHKVAKSENIHDLKNRIYNRVGWDSAENVVIKAFKDDVVLGDVVTNLNNTVWFSYQVNLFSRSVLSVCISSFLFFVLKNNCLTLSAQGNGDNPEECDGPDIHP